MNCTHNENTCMKTELYQRNVKIQGLSMEPGPTQVALINAHSKRIISNKIA